MYIENIVIGRPLVDEYLLFACDKEDWFINESVKTVWDNERYLPRLLVKYGFSTSTSEIKRNRSDLMITLDKVDFIQIKLGKKKCWIAVGE
jgi:hypothetical protein